MRRGSFEIFHLLKYFIDERAYGKHLCEWYVLRSVRGGLGRLQSMDDEAVVPKTCPRIFTPI
jgi:hypothetical protein